MFPRPSPDLYRCSTCAISWPPREKYRVCSQCGEKCSPMTGDEPISDEEAERLWAFAEFERQFGPAEVG